MAQELFVGHTVSFGGGSYQNYQLGVGNFLPFGFSGIVISREGGNVSASLTFPHNALSKGVINDLINSRSVVTVTEVCNGGTVFTYVGQATSGSIAEEANSLELTSVLDAVSADVPWRYLTEDLVGPLPTMSGVQLQ